MNKEQLDVIKKRVKNATPGEWEWRKEPKYAEESIVSLDGISDDRPWAIEVLRGGCGQNTGFLDYENDYDMEFIAHARQDVPALITEVERLREALKFYADEENYYRSYTEDFSKVHNEGGKIARQVLEEK